MSAQPQSRKFTISFPEDLAKKVDQLAEQESRNTSELFREAFRVYFARQIRAQMAESRELVGNVNPAGYAKDTHRLVDNVRREIKASRK
jgi:metal-responsive CopG/Arc/MetJ family transcriptional regulator